MVINEEYKSYCNGVLVSRSGKFFYSESGNLLEYLHCFRPLTGLSVDDLVEIPADVIKSLEGKGANDLSASIYNAALKLFTDCPELALKVLGDEKTPVKSRKRVVVGKGRTRIASMLSNP
jgi:hypothetical protein